MAALAKELLLLASANRQLYWPSSSEKTDALKICFCPCTWAPGTARRFSSYDNMERFKRAQLAGCCCKCSKKANLYGPPSSCNDVIDLVVSQITSSSAKISWTMPVGPFTFDIYLNDVIIGNTSQHSYTISRLRSSKTYTVSVIAKDESCVSNKTTKTFTTIGPNISNLTYSLKPNQDCSWTCDLSWNTVGYHYYKIISNNITIFSGLLLIHTYTIPNILNETDYTVIVQLMNGTAVLSESSVTFPSGSNPNC